MPDESLRPASTLLSVTNEDSVLEEAIANLREAAQRVRATQNLMHSQGMTENVNYRELLMRLSTALAMTEAAYVEAKRRRG
jgi:two-component sensor histidine kinase